MKWLSKYVEMFVESAKSFLSSASCSYVLKIKRMLSLIVLFFLSIVWNVHVFVSTVDVPLALSFEDSWVISGGESFDFSLL